MNITKDLAIQGTEYIKQFCEKLRLDPNVDLMKCMSYQDIASCYISLQRIETFVTTVPSTETTVPSTETTVPSTNVEVETLQKLLQKSAEKITNLQQVISNLDARLLEHSTEAEKQEEIQVIELPASYKDEVPAEPQEKKPRRKQISQIVTI